jgi:hypothetical protein
MNTPQSFSLGWGAFYAAGVAGAFLGYQRWKAEHAVRVVENIEHTRKRNELLELAEERLRKEGRIKPKKVIQQPVVDEAKAAENVGASAIRAVTEEVKKEEEEAEKENSNAGTEKP